MFVCCDSCGAKFDEKLPKCPYCGSMNVKGAEAEYFNQLEDIRENMEDLKEVPEEAIKREAKRQGKFIGTIIFIIGILILVVSLFAYWSYNRYKRDNKADYIWQQENYPIMNQMYEEERYEELITFYLEASSEQQAVWNWEHDTFLNLYMNAIDSKDIIAQEQTDGKRSKEEYEWLFYMESSIISAPFHKDLTEEELERLDPYRKEIHADFKARWNMSDAEYEKYFSDIEKKHGVVDAELCEQYVEKWYKGWEE